MKKKALTLLAQVPLALASCGKSAPELSDYLVSYPGFQGKSSLNVLQLTDIHWSAAQDYGKEDAYLRALVKNSGADLIVTTGDNFLSASRRTVQELYGLFDSLQKEDGTPIYWAITLGNHDKQGTYDPDYPVREATKREHCLNKIVEDEITGDCNSVIDLVEEEGKPLWQLYLLDSNSLAPSLGSLTSPYDVIRQEQIDWYRDETLEAKKKNADVSSLCFFHIPLWESEYAYRLSKGEKADGEVGRYSGEEREAAWNVDGLGSTSSYVGYEDTGFFAMAESLGSTKAMFYGHDHINDFAAEYSRKVSTAEKAADKIALCYGLKSGDGLYYDSDMIGGNLATIGKDGSLELSRCYQTYQSDYSNQAGFKKEAMFA